MLPETRILYFFTAYKFTQEGVAVVEKNFAKELAKRNLAANYRYCDEGCYFIVQCWDVQQVYKLFHSIVSALINSEKDASDDESDNDSSSVAFDPFEDTVDEDLQSSKIIRLPRVNQQSNCATTLKNTEDITLTPSSSYPEEIRFFKFRAIWKHEYSPSLDEIFPNPIIQTLQEKTGCKLLKDSKGQQFFIGAHHPQHCNDALRKLGNISKIAVRVPYLNHVFYTEDLGNIQVAVKPILDIKKKRVDTTLLDWKLEGGSDIYDPYRTKVHKSYTVVCCSWDPLRGIFIPVKHGKLISAAKDDDLGKEFDPWMKFIYYAKGEPKQEPGDMSSQNQDQELLGDQAPTAQIAISKSRIGGASNHNERIQNWRTEIQPESVVTKIHNTMATMPPRPLTQQDPRKSSGWDQQLNTTVHLVKATQPTRPPLPDSTPLLNSRLQELGLSKLGQQTTISMPRNATQPDIPGPQDPKSRVQVIPDPNPRNLELHRTTFQPSAFTADLKEFPPLGSSALNQANLPSEQASTRKATQVKKARTTLKVTTDLSHAKNQLSPFRLADFPQDQHSLLDDSPPRIATPPRNFVPLSNPSPPPPPRPSQSVNLLDESIEFFNAPVLQPIVHSISTKNDNNMQAIDEVATRTYHNTMNQRAPKPLHAPGNTRDKKKGQGNIPLFPQGPVKALTAQPDKIVDPLPEFATMTKSNFYKMLDGLEGFRGRLKVQAEFGRIMLTKIARNDIAPGDTLNSMPPEQLRSILLRQKTEPTAGPHVFFTNVLSTVPADMQYIVDLENAENEKLWESKLGWDVVYEIRCLDRRVERDIPFVIFIDAETFDTRVMAEEQLLGQVYMHCTKNAWDIRLTAVGLTRKDDEYGEIAEAIVDSLYIKSGSTLPELEFELPTSMLQSVTPIEIEHVRVRRNCKYKSFDHKSVLKISEVNQLVTLSQSRENGTNYLSSTNHPAVLAEKMNSKPGEEYFWYEVSISAANECFDQNEKVELGEQAGWSVASLEKEDLGSALILPALSMVKNMDGVGHHSDNGRGQYLRERATRGSSSIGPDFAPYW